MKVAGIVAEYNPFHNGHKYHIEKTKEETGATHIAAVMSGDFVMRGEPALCGKQERAKAAVMGGCDLVIEMPICYSLSSAEYFAYGGVYILNAMGCVDFLSFGSEEGELENLCKIADMLLKPEMQSNIKEQMKKGIPVFKAISESLNEFADILEKPNNILGINYIKALKRLNSKIMPYTLKREGDGYNEETALSEIASAKTLRNMLLKGEDISAFVPNSTCEILEKPVFEENFDLMMTYALRMADINKIKSAADVNEGLENLIKKAAFSANTVKDIADEIKSKRYAYTRIKRILYNILLDIPETSRKKNPEYIKILAFNEKGRELLSEMKKTSSLPVITNVSKKDFQSFYGIREDYTASAIYTAASGDKIKGLKAEIILQNKSALRFRKAPFNAINSENL